MRLTEEAIRAKAEHHDGLLSDLEELSLHQCEIERIEALGTLCPRLRILLLQNNIISRIEGLRRLKCLEYLNLALNNIRVLEGMSTCESLSKLDMTVNFIDFDTLEASVTHLKSLASLRELFLMGNPVSDWDGCRPYVIASLHQLALLDGKEITRSERILAAQRMSELTAELETRAAARAATRAAEAPTELRAMADDEATPYTPEVRTSMYREMAEQKADEEGRRKAMQPPKRDYAAEHASTVERVRDAEADGSGNVKQRNDGKYDFTMTEDDGACVLSVAIPRHLDTAMVDLDVHPHYVSMVIKGKVLRLRWPSEVLPDEGRAQRSKTTGELVVTVPLADSRGGHLLSSKARREAERAEAEKVKHDAAVASGRVKRIVPRAQPMMLDEATAAASGGASGLHGAVSIRGIADESHGGVRREALLTEVAIAARKDEAALVDDDDVPPLE